MSREIITRNHQTLVAVLEGVARRTFNSTAASMARTMLGVIQGCTSSKLVGVSYDRGLPYVGYAKDRAFLYDLGRRKMAPIGRFYKLYINRCVTQEQRDAFEMQVVAEAERQGLYCPSKDYAQRAGTPAVNPTRNVQVCRQTDDEDGDW